MKRVTLMLCALVACCAVMACDSFIKKESANQEEIAKANVTKSHVVTNYGESIALPEGCEQLIVVEGTYGVSCNVYIYTFADGSWTSRLINGVTGYGGIASYGTKHEGDGKTPAGTFALKRGLCYVQDFVSYFPMEVYNERYMWDENVNSPTYNTLLRNPAPGTKGDRIWDNHDKLYRYIVVVEYNTDPVIPGAGSAIFIHAWRAPGKPTAGCVGMSQSDMKSVVEWLNPSKCPHIVVLPAGTRLDRVIINN